MICLPFIAMDCSLKLLLNSENSCNQCPRLKDVKSIDGKYHRMSCRNPYKYTLILPSLWEEDQWRVCRDLKRSILSGDGRKIPSVRFGCVHPHDHESMQSNFYKWPDSLNDEGHLTKK